LWRFFVFAIFAGIHVVPPEKFGTGEFGIFSMEGIPDFQRGDEVIGLYPELNFGEFTIVPADARNISRGFVEVV
jgi:hypothetical protein